MPLLAEPIEKALHPLQDRISYLESIIVQLPHPRIEIIFVLLYETCASIGDGPVKEGERSAHGT